MATATVTKSAQRALLAEAENQPWEEIEKLCRLMGSVVLDPKTPDLCGDGARTEKAVWVWMLTIVAYQHGLMAVRDGYNETLRFSVIE